jgi:perosamine synthetase
MKVPQFMPFVGMEEYEAIKQCFETNWITEGPLAKEFNQKLCEKIGVKYGVYAPNGTLALILGLKALGIGPGDEVIVPDVTFFASATSVEFLGAKPVFVDVCENLQINVEDCDRVLTEKTKAIMPVHLFGFTSNMDQVMAYARKHNLLVIEDAAQALGIKWKGKGCGSFGDVGCFSFFADKTLTTAEGGFVTTNNEEVYEKLLYLRNQGRRGRGTFVHPQVGYNFRMTDIQCAIGLAQMKKFDTLVEKKNFIHKKYTEAFSEFKHVDIYQPPEEVCPYIPFRVILKTKKDEAEDLMQHMRENDVEPRMFFYPLHLQPAFEYWKKDPRYNREHFPVAEKSYDNGICLPSFVNISEEQINYVCEVIKDFYV